MSEFMGLVYGVYDAKPGGFVPGGMSLHNALVPHGPDAEAFERASAKALEPEKLAGTLAFMFETRHVLEPTAYSLRPRPDRQPAIPSAGTPSPATSAHPPNPAGPRFPVSGPSSRPEGGARGSREEALDLRKACANAPDNRLGQVRRKVLRQRFQHGCHCHFRRVRQPRARIVDQAWVHAVPDRRLHEVTRQNRGHRVVATVAHRQREPESGSSEPAGIDIGLGRHDVVERGQDEAASRLQEDAEILRVSVRRAPTARTRSAPS